MTGLELKKLRYKANLTQEELGIELGMSKNTIYNYENGAKIPKTKLALINIFFQKLGLITKSPTLETIINSIDAHQVKEPQEAYNYKNTDSSNKKIPFYDVEAIGGDKMGAEMTAKTEPTSTIDIGDILRDSENAMRVYGNSMTPNYPSGCVIGLKRVYDSFIEPGNVYVVETRDNRYVKRLYNHDNPELIECYSDNISKFTEGPREGKYFYEPFSIPKSEIISLHRVVGVIKRNINQ